MIHICDEFKINLEINTNPSSFTIFAYERIMIPPESQKLIKLPYFRNNFDKYYNFELNGLLAKQGLVCLWNNINDNNSAGSCLEFLIKNLNNNEIYNALTAIIGSGRKVDILSGFKFGTIYE